MASALSYLVKRLGISNKEAIVLIGEKKMLVNGVPAGIRQPLFPTDEIIANGQLLQAPEQRIYLAYHKPRGVECTLNTDIAHNLVEALNLPERVFPIGRLDKESEGLLLLTNDGSLYNQLAHSENHIEKEYVVKVDKPLTKEVLQQLREGVEIMGKKTRPAVVKVLDDVTFNIVLTQGLNRQIRRMCYKLGYEVVMLKRIRVAEVVLGDLEVGGIRMLSWGK